MDCQHRLLGPPEQAGLVARFRILVQIPEFADKRGVIAPQCRADRSAHQIGIVLPIAPDDIHHGFQIQITQRLQIVPALRIPACARIRPEGGPHPIAAVGDAHPFGHRRQMAYRILVVFEGSCRQRGSQMHVPSMYRLISLLMPGFQLEIVPLEP
ncbi:hypothetical protein D3C73_766590 [compost metagenome]